MNAVLLAACVLSSPVEGLLTQDKKNPEEVRVTVDLDNVTVQEAVDFMKLVSTVPIELDAAASKKIDAVGKVSLKVANTTLIDALRLLFQPHGLDVTVVEKKKVVITVPKGR